MRGRARKAVRWLVFADSRGVARNWPMSSRQRARLACSLNMAADSRRPLVRRAMAIRRTRDRFTIDPLNEQDYQRLIDEAFPPTATCVGVVHLWSLDIPEKSANESRPFKDTGEDLARSLGCGSVLQLVRALSRSTRCGSRRCGWSLPERSR